jgi:hypothetical protein
LIVASYHCQSRTGQSKAKKPRKTEEKREMGAFFFFPRLPPWFLISGRFVALYFWIIAKINEQADPIAVALR